MEKIIDFILGSLVFVWLFLGGIIFFIILIVLLPIILIEEMFKFFFRIFRK